MAPKQIYFTILNKTPQINICTELICCVLNSCWLLKMFLKEWRFVSCPLQAILGGRVRLMVTGAAPVSPTVLTFLRTALGCHVSAPLHTGTDKLLHPASRLHHISYLADAFLQSNLQFIWLNSPWSNVGWRALLKGPTAAWISLCLKPGLEPPTFQFAVNQLNHISAYENVSESCSTTAYDIWAIPQ